MLYTVGFKESYDAGLAEGLPYRKLGKGKDHKGRPYLGGCVFASPEDAQRYIQNHNKIGYDIYGLDTSLDNTEQLEGESHRRLLSSCNIIRLG